MTVRDEELKQAGPWPLGVNNQAKEHELPADENGTPVALREAVNVDLDNVGWPSRRRGFQRATDGVLPHSLWSCDELEFGLFVDDGELMAVFPNGTTRWLETTLGHQPVSYQLINDRVFFSNRGHCGVVTMDLEVLPWAPDHPLGQPMLTPQAGFSLSAGQYQVAVTFTDLLGRESGCTRAATVQLADEQGIALASIPQPSNAALTPVVNVYVTGPNDQVLRLATTIPAGITSGLVATAARGRSLTTQFLVPMPAGQIVRYANGRQFVAVGREMLWSDALRYGMYHPDNRVRFTKPIDLMEPVGNDGFLVASGKRTYWLAGRDPMTFEPVIRRGSGALPGAVRVPGNVLGLDTKDDLPVWMARSGHLCVGVPGGGITVLKDGQAVAPAATGAALLFRQQDGLQQVIAALRGTRPQGLAVSDRAVAHVLYDGSKG